MENNLTIAVFPGQGAQKVGMAKDLYEASLIAKELYQIADQALGFPISKICFEGPEDQLVLTANVQPAILTHSCIAYRMAQEKLGQNWQPTVAAGHSLGEYSALVAAEAISFADAVVLVHKRGKYMQSAVPVGVGAMLAVLGQEVTTLETALKDFSDLEIANINAPGQIVISGSAKSAKEFQLRNAGFKMIPLPVSAPFHCKLMQSAQDLLSKDLDSILIKTPKFPVISNFLARPLTQPEEIRQALKEQVTGKVRWVESMELAIKDFEVKRIIEFGPGNVLTGLMKRINKDLEKVNYQAVSDF